MPRALLALALAALAAVAAPRPAVGDAPELELPVVATPMDRGVHPDPNLQFEVSVARDGAIRIAGTPVAAGDLKKVLLARAELERDFSHPDQPSSVCVLVAADARTPWRHVRDLMATCDDPAVRLWRIFWVVRSGESGEKIAVDVRFARNRAPRDREVVLHRRAPASVYLSIDEEKVEHWSFCGEEVGTGEEGAGGLEGAVRRQPASHYADTPGDIRADGEVPFGDVVRAGCILRGSGIDTAAESVVHRPPFVRFETPSEPDSEDASALEKRLFPDADTRPRMLARLEQSTFTPEELRELGSALHADPTAMESLAIRYLEAGDEKSIFRALSLTGLLMSERASPAYSDAWWNWLVLTCRGWNDYAEKQHDPRGAENVIRMHDALDKLGVLARSPVREKLEGILRRALQLTDGR